MTDSDNGKSEAAVAPRPSAMPQVSVLGAADINLALKKGIADFLNAPLYGLFFGGVFTLAGIVIVMALTVWNVSWMIYPFAIGFPLVGPFAAVGLYCVSRRLEAGEPLGWGPVLSVVWAQRRRELSWMAFVMLFVMWIWLYMVRLLIALFLGRLSFSTLDKFFNVVLTTTDGWIFLAVGHVFGAVLALVMFSITVVSIPLLMERDIDIVTAMITSVKTVMASPVVMVSWGVFVTLAVIAASLPIFLGLVVVLPVLGHTTWHIYRAAVVPVSSSIS